MCRFRRAGPDSSGPAVTVFYARESPVKVEAHGLALAFLDGKWRVAAMVERARIAFGVQRPIFVGVARRVLERFPSPPHDAAGTLARFIASDSGFQGAVTRMRRSGHLHVRRLSLPDAAMGEPPPFVRGLDLPPLAAAADLSRFLGLDDGRLLFLADPRGWNRARRDPVVRHYRYRWVPKRSGSSRLIEAPKERLKDVQRRILAEIVGKVPPHEAAHGFRAGRSIVTHASPHCRKIIVVRMDLEDFFAHVAVPRVRGLFRLLGYPETVAALLARLCCAPTPSDVLVARPRDAARLNERMHERTLYETPHLPQGAPTSPALANLIAYRLDVRLAGLAAKLGAVYTRYADDLAFSGDEALDRSVGRLLALTGAVAIEEGFAVRFRKTRVMRSGRRQQLAGITVNVHPALRRSDVDRLKAILTNCVRNGPLRENREGRPDFRAYLAGRVGYVQMVSPRRGAKLRRLFDAISW
jgi:hypothetical protein